MYQGGSSGKQGPRPAIRDADKEPPRDAQVWPCEWSFEQGDRKWQQDEQELGFELVGDFFGRRKECVGAGISGEDPRGVHEARGRTLHPRGPTVAPLHLSRLPHTPSSSQRHFQPAQTRVQAHFAAIFDLLAQGTSHKTAWGDCSLVCDSSIGPISFCSSALFIANLCCLGDHVLELACQIYMVPSSSNA